MITVVGVCAAERGYPSRRHPRRVISHRALRSAALIPLVLLLLADIARGQSSPADQPTPRTDKNSQIAHEQLLAKARAGRIDVYFAGDSITRRWGALDYPEFLASWRQNFFGWNAANFGWGADQTQHILWRLVNGELDDVHPKVIVLLAGTNNLGGTLDPAGDVERAADVSRGIKAILDVMRDKAPRATIVLMGVLPRNDNVNLLPTINLINARLATFADGKTIRFLNINDRLATLEGRLLDGMMADGLHPATRGYQVWADALKPIFTELLGPPAKEDLAPPPTGDPSARK
jgi:lysophospholipase L1-like esterase